MYPPKKREQREDRQRDYQLPQNHPVSAAGFHVGEDREEDGNVAEGVHNQGQSYRV